MNNQSGFAAVYGHQGNHIRKTVSFTLKMEHNGCLIIVNTAAGNVNVTVPIGLQPGFFCRIFHEAGGNACSVAAGGGLTYVALAGMTAIAEGGAVDVVHYEANKIFATGDLA